MLCAVRATRKTPLVLFAARPFALHGALAGLLRARAPSRTSRVAAPVAHSVLPGVILRLKLELDVSSHSSLSSFVCTLLLCVGLFVPPRRPSPDQLVARVLNPKWPGCASSSSVGRHVGSFGNIVHFLPAFLPSSDTPPAFALARR